MKRFVSCLSVSKSKFYTWIEGYGKVNEHNAPIPRDFWLEPWEREAIIKFAENNPLERYRRLTFMMLDQNIVEVSPSSTWRVFTKASMLQKWNKKTSLKGTGFIQPLRPHEHWHVDFRIATFMAPSTTCAAFWMVAVDLSSIGRSESR